MSEKEKKKESKKEEKPIEKPKKEDSKTESKTEEVVEEKGESQFQSQLVQALELNDKLIESLEQKEKDISAFQQIKFGLENVITEKEKHLLQLQQQLEQFITARLNERKAVIFQKCMSNTRII